MDAASITAGSPVTPSRRSHAAPCYAAFLMHVATGHGGHIGIAGTGKSLCGVERRFPNNEREQDFEGDEFAAWIKQNEPFVCRLCLRIWRRNEKGQR